MLGNPIAIGDTRAGSFEALDQAGDVERSGELHDEVHVILNDAQSDNADTMSLGFGEQEAAEKVSYRRLDQREPREGGPGQMGIKSNGHEILGNQLREGLRGGGTRRTPTVAKARCDFPSLRTRRPAATRSRMEHRRDPTVTSAR